MANSLPHAFNRAYTLVVNALNSAIEEFKRTRSFPNAMPIRDAIERFLYEIELNDVWYAELARRADLVQSCCGVRTEYVTMRRRALARKVNARDGQVLERQALKHLASPFTLHPVFLSEVVEIRKSIESLFRDKFLTTKSKDGAEFATWHKVCRGIEREGTRLEVDGCWYLLQFNSAAELDAPLHSRVARGLAESDLGVSNLAFVLAAVRSMAAWIGDPSRTRQPNSVAVELREHQLEPVGSSINRELTDGESTADIPVEEPSAEPPTAAPQPFSGGQMVFLEDRVELCSVDICSGGRSASARKTLELLATQRNGAFIAVGAGKLAELLKREKGAASVVGLVRGIRSRINKALAPQGIRVERGDVITRTKRGYQLSPKVSVQNALEQPQGESGEAKLGKFRSDDPNRSDPNDPSGRRSHDPNGPNRDVRRAWILRQLGLGRELRAPDISRELGCSLKSAKRDLKALRDQGKIEFAGSLRTGFYRLRASGDSDSASSGN